MKYLRPFLKRAKTTLSIAAVSVASLAAAAASIEAHDGWVQMYAPVVAQGEVAYAELLFGNHSNEHRSYRIAGQWNPDASRVYVTTPDGRKVDVTASRFYTGEPATDTEPAVNNGFIASFSSSAPGAYIVTVEGDSVFRHGDQATRTLRSAKAFVAVADVPLAARVRDLRGFSRQVTPDRAEFVPEFNPAAVVPGDRLAVRLLLKGKPLAGTQVSVIRRSTSESAVYTTDANGLVTFTAGPADYYLVRAKPQTQERIEGQYDATNYEATMTFVVQNSRSSVAAASACGDPCAPDVYVDGRRVDTGGAVLIRGGTTYAGADWMRVRLGVQVEDRGEVALRAKAEAAGATVEFLPAVGDVRPAVLIYTRKG